VAYVYFRIPSNLDVQIITLLSAPPDANLFPTVDKGYNILLLLLQRESNARDVMLPKPFQVTKSVLQMMQMMGSA